MFKKGKTENVVTDNKEKQSPDKEMKNKRKREKVKPTDIVKPVAAQNEEESEQRKKIPKGLPSHWGPKVRS